MIQTTNPYATWFVPVFCCSTCQSFCFPSLPYRPTSLPAAAGCGINKAYSNCATTGTALVYTHSRGTRRPLTGPTIPSLVSCRPSHSTVAHTDHWTRHPPHLTSPLLTISLDHSSIPSIIPYHSQASVSDSRMGRQCSDTSTPLDWASLTGSRWSYVELRSHLTLLLPDCCVV